MIIKRLQKAGCDVQFSLTDYAKSSSGILHQDVDGMFAKFVSEVTSEKVKLNTKNCRDSGVCTYKAPIRYLNEGIMEHKPFDPVRSPIVKQLFELYATGEWSMHSLAKWANAQGLTMPPVKRRRTPDEILAEVEDDIRLEIEAVCRPIEYKQVARILSNRFYTARIMGNIKGEWIMSTSHQALVSDELFDEVQAILKKKNVSQHYKEVPDTPYRALIKCAECNRVYTPYFKKDSVYLGSRCKGGCGNSIKSLSSNEVEGLVGNLIKNLSLPMTSLLKWMHGPKLILPS